MLPYPALSLFQILLDMGAPCLYGCLFVCMYVCVCVCMYVLLSLLLQQLVCLIQRIALTDVFSLTTWGMGCVYTKRLTRDMTRVILLWFMAFCIISVYSLCLSVGLSLSLRCQVFICTYVHTCVFVCVRVCVCVCVCVCVKERERERESF